MNEPAQPAPQPPEQTMPADAEKLAKHLTLISRIGRTILSKLQVGDLLHGVADAVWKHFKYYDVSIFLVDPEAHDCVLVAHSGEFSIPANRGYRQRTGVGIVGWVAEHGETVLANDVRKDPRHIAAFEEKAIALSELAVPIRLHDHVVGIINIENREPDAFDSADVMAIEALAEQVAQSIANAQLFERTRLLRDLNRSIIDAMPSGLCVLDDHLRLLYANPAFGAMFGLNESASVGEPLQAVLPEKLLKQRGIESAAHRALAETGSHVFAGVEVECAGQAKVLNVRVTPAQTPEGLSVLMMFEDVTEWRKASALAAERLSHLETIVSHVPVAVVSWDLDHHFTFWGSGAANLFGRPEEDILGKATPHELFEDPDELDRLIAECAEAPAEGELWIQRADGLRVPVLTVIGQLRDDNDAHIGYSGIVLDVTERRRAEEQVVREKQKLENVVQVIGAGLALIDRDHRFTWTNQKITEWFGRGQDLDDRICHPICCRSETAAEGCPVARCFATEQSTQTEVPLVRSDDAMRRYNLAFTPIRGHSHQIDSVLMLCLDVTDQAKKVFQLTRLRQFGELMQGVLDLDRLLKFVLTCVTAGQGLGFNRAMLFLVDYDRHVMEGRLGVGPANAEEAGRIWSQIAEDAVSLEDLLARVEHGPHDMSAMDRLAMAVSVSLDDADHILVQCASARKPVVVENAGDDPRVREDFRSLVNSNRFVLVPLIAQNRSVGVVLADNLYSGEPIDQENVELLCMFANQAAIAIENAESYQRLEEEKAHLEQAYRDLADAQDKLVRSERLVAIGRMAAHVAHEIRNPLVNIGGFANAMSTRHDMPREDIEKYASIISGEVRRLEGILARVMDFAKPPHPLVRRARVDAVILDTLDQLRPRAREQEVEVVTNLNDGETALYIDPDQIKQVLLNLFQNALDAMKEGGLLEIGSRVAGRNIVITVRNTGRPIHPEDLANLFEPFFSTKPGGTGLGLTVSQKIIQDHGGDIRAASSLARGTIFTITLPLQRRLDRSLGYRPGPVDGRSEGK